jgi:hypothetical protein
MTGPATIDSCGRTIAASVVAFDIVWSGELPADREVTWAVRVTSDDAASQLELGHRRDGSSVVQYARDLGTGRVQQLDADADVEDGEVTVRFPADVVGVAVEWPTWQAVLEVDGEDVATCAMTV